MVYSDPFVHLSVTDSHINYNLPRMRGNETPSDWKDRIWDILMEYRKNHLLTDSNKRYLIARKQTYLLYQCDEVGISISMHSLWRTNCTGNEYCDMSFEDYMKLKNNPPPCYFTKKAIRRYEMWLENVSNRIRRIRQKHKVQSNVASLTIFITIHMNNTFSTPPFLKKPVQHQRYDFQRESWMDKPRSLTSPPLPPKPVALMSGFERYTMRRSASAPEISAYRFERSQVLIDAEAYFDSVREIDLISFN
ncbi:unnamed protein product [Rhizophagus irregularis]|nr:unnamed protein product [Rhizophagus irregularis]